MSRSGKRLITIPDMHPLGALIESQRKKPDNRWSYQDIANQSEAAGCPIAKSTVQDLATKPMKPTITRANVFGLAAGLKVTALTVARAALSSWGIDTSGLEVTDSLATIAIDPTLSQPQKNQLRALVTSMRDSAGSPDNAFLREGSGADYSERPFGPGFRPPAKKSGMGGDK